MKTRYLSVIFRDRKLFVSVALIIAGLIFLVIYLSRDNVNAKSDLVGINAKLYSFSFKRSGIRNDHYGYYLHLVGFKNRFQIIADFVDCFDKDSFERNMRNGDSLRIYISSNDFKNIGTQNDLRLFGIYNGTASFLDCEYAIDRYNNCLPLIFSFIFIIIGGLIFYYNEDKLQLKEK